MARLLGMLHLAWQGGRRLGRAGIPGLSAAARVWFLSIDHRRAHGSWPRLRRPRSYSEKLTRKILCDRRSYLVDTADKVAVRDHVAALVGEAALPRLYAVCDDPSTLSFDDLPESFVMKAAHASGWVVLVPDRSRADPEHLRATAATWIRSVYEPLGSEWWYGAIPRRVIIEEFLGHAALGAPPDYKLFVTNGQVRLIEVDVDRTTAHKQAFYSPGWERLEVARGYPPAGDVARPVNLATMIDMAERLSAGTDFVRVDLYDLDDRVVFGELTHSPSAGHEPFKPPAFDLWLGERWDQPRRYVEVARSGLDGTRP